jgi:pimeloyl-ACP methyl ester carboxylesterase
MRFQNLFNISVLLLLTGFSTTLYAQTGPFKVNIDFMGMPRQLSFFVPTNYDSTKAYKLMVGLHGLGDNSENYRNGLISSLHFDTVFKNTIFVFPEASTVNSDFYVPAGSEEIINESIKYARSKYNIDEDNIMLQGFSLGGRAALRFGLDNPTKFKGLLLNTPAVQGIKETGNRSLSKYTFNYANAPQIPIYITIGRQDAFYSNIADSVFIQLVRHNGKVHLQPFGTMAHNVPQAATLMNVIPFFDMPAKENLDLEFIKASVPKQTCNATVNATVLMRNTGKNPIKSVFFVAISPPATEYNWTGSLKSFEYAEFTIPGIPAKEGTNLVDFYVSAIVDENNDTIYKDYDTSFSFIKSSNGKALPFSEDFEGKTFPPAGWSLNKSGEAYAEWDHSSNAGKNFGAAFTVNTILLFDNAGNRDELVSPVLDLSSLPKPNLRFNVAYNYHQYTPPYTSVDTVFADTLEVLISTDCGNSFSSIYKKGGKDLATFSKPMKNITSLGGLLNTPRDTNWRYEAIDLSGFAATGNEAIIKFSYISAMGGIIYLDNVLVGNASLGITEEDKSELKIYPNPANNIIYISHTNAPVKLVEIADISGRIVQAQNNPQGNTTLSVNTSGLKAGVYMVKVQTAGKTEMRKILISR